MPTTYTISTDGKKSTRDAMLEAAVQLFTEQGTEVRLEDIAQRAGVSRQSGYIYFVSKMGLLLGIGSVCGRAGAGRGEGAAGLPSGDGVGGAGPLRFDPDMSGSKFLPSRGRKIGAPHHSFGKVCAIIAGHISERDIQQ
ncbi:MAG: helix-turn-helix transcriptional regulator [SAR202 cluster bacterium]|nr:helix-turn-helix transcriptional regulator [SAR202 cluster bacterium]